MTRPKISICVPTFNHELYIRECLVSVVGQDVDADIEVLVGDDGSSDGTAEIVEDLASRHEGRIRYFRRAKNIGPFENLKQLVREASGDFIAHLDGDDYWQPGKLKAQLVFLQNNPDCVACYTNAWVVYDDLSPLGVFNNKLPNKFDLRFLLAKGNFLNHSSICYRSMHKNCVLDCPQRFIDYRIHIELAMCGPLGYLNVSYVTYRYASSQSMIKRSGQSVRLMYFDALQHVFDANEHEDLYVSAFGDFVARIVKDGVSIREVGFYPFWFDMLRTNIKKSRARVLATGLFMGLRRIFSSSLRRVCGFLGIDSGMRVVNER